MKLMMGKHKGKELSEVPTEYLAWITDTYDPDDPKYGAKNKILILAAHNEINRRTDAEVGNFTPRQRQLKELPVIQLAPKTTVEVIKEVKLFIDDLYKKATSLQKLMDEHTSEGVITRNSEHTPF